MNKRRKRGRAPLQINGVLAAIILILILAIILVVNLVKLKNSDHRSIPAYEHSDTLGLEIEEWPELDVELLDENPYSRPGTALEKVNGIVIHYTANPGASARANRDYFNGLAQSRETYASSHFIVGLEGEIVQCIPCNEIAYASNDRNSDTISIECCIEDETGKFNDETYDSVIELTAWLMGRYDIPVDNVIRHYDVTGKMCPKYFVEHEDEWELFKKDAHDYLKEHGKVK